MAMPDANRSSRGHRWLIVVAVFAAATHGAAFFLSPPQPSPDAEEYIALGKSLATTGALVLPTGEKAKRMPLYPVLIAGVYGLVGEEHFETGALVVQCLLAVASTAAIALTAHRLGGALAGVIAGLLTALYAPFIYLQSLCLTETLMVFLLSASVLVYVGQVARPQGISTASLAAVSALLALAALTRANTVVLLVPFIVDAAARGRAWPTRLCNCAVLLLPTMVVLGAWAFRNEREVGAFTLSTSGGLNFYLGHNPKYAQDPGLARADYAAFDRLRRDAGNGEVEADRKLFDEGTRFAAENPAITAVNLLRKLRVYHAAATTDSAPSVFLICLAAVVFAGHRLAHGKIGDPLRRAAYLAALAGLVTTALIWIDAFLHTYRPWADSAHLVPLGLCALVLLRSQPRVRGLLIGLYVAEMLIALVFIPLARLRWTVDGLLIIALAVGMSNLCNWLAGGRATGAAGHSAELPNG
jgi:4-amino-4-deoxy-L-arabinose transferase-like glycosyltransferase